MPRGCPVTHIGCPAQYDHARPLPRLHPEAARLDRIKRRRGESGVGVRRQGQAYERVIQHRHRHHWTELFPLRPFGSGVGAEVLARAQEILK